MCEDDGDGDGYSESCGDCDDGNADINPGAEEECNKIDDNCNGKIDEDCETECGECEDMVTMLTLRYLGDGTVRIRVIQKKGNAVVFDDDVVPEEEFSFEGQWKKGTLGTEIRIYEAEGGPTKIHTSCSRPIGPGMTVGNFLIVYGESRKGGPLCPVDKCHDCSYSFRSGMKIDSDTPFDIDVDGSEDFEDNLSSVHKISLSGKDKKKIVEFKWNFSSQTSDISIKYDKGYIVVSGLELMNQTKSVFLEKAHPPYKFICLLDKEIDDIDKMTKRCKGKDEIKLHCPGNKGKYICEDQGDVWKISGLKHSAVRGITEEDESEPSSSGVSWGGGGSGGGSAPSEQETCEEYWRCSHWTGCKDGQQTRECTDYYACGTQELKPAETRECEEAPAIETEKPAAAPPAAEQTEEKEGKESAKESPRINRKQENVVAALMVIAVSFLMIFLYEFAVKPCVKKKGRKKRKKH